MELYGKKDGICGGKGGSMHLFDSSKKFMGGHAIVGGQFPVATGLALACQYKKTGGLVVCFFGDGSTNQGTYHETLNLASVWNLPILFILVNIKSLYVKNLKNLPCSISSNSDNSFVLKLLGCCSFISEYPL